MNQNELKVIEEFRVQILNAALHRFQQYGYGKTTMAEIASDSNMSAANLYRYFKNKQDIASAVVADNICCQHDNMREIIRRPDRNSAQKLREMVIEGLKLTYQMYVEQPKINELVEFIASERQDMVHEKIKNQISLITELLVQGNQSGEFDIDDVVTTARAVQSSLVKFTVPLFMALHPIDEFITIANEVVDLLLLGLRKTK